MKRGQLRSIAHSIAHSLASVSLMTGYYDLDLYGDAMRSPGGELSLDLKNGSVIAGNPSPDLVAATLRMRTEFDRLCQRAGISRDDCRKATAHFFATLTYRGFTLVIEDSIGRRTETDYAGFESHRAFEKIAPGRYRRKPIRVLEPDLTAALPL